MSERKVTYEELDYPDISIDGAKYYMLCEFMAKNGAFTTVYAEEEGKKVVIKLPESKAIVDLFSLEEEQLPRLFGYIESSLRKDDDLITYASGIMNDLLAQAERYGRKYPILEQAIEGHKANAFSRVSSQLAQIFASVGPSSAEIREHTVSFDPLTPGREEVDMSDIEPASADTQAPVKAKEAEASFILGKYDVFRIMREVESNAWFGGDPQSISLTAGSDVITIQGYVYEPIYEYFSSTSSISLNGQVLYGLDSRNVAAYRNEEYHLGIYQNLNDALAHIQEVTKGKEIVSQFEQKQSLIDRIKCAAARKSVPAPDESKSTPEVSR